MSNLEDIPLGDDDQRTSPNNSDNLKRKSSSLKRFFKMGKKPGTQSESSLQTTGGSDNTAAVSSTTGIESINENEGRNSIRKRFQLRLRGAKSSTTDAAAVAAEEATEGAGVEAGTPESVDAPQTPPKPNTKPTIKSSISNYWHSLFKRHQAAKDTDGDVADEATIENANAGNTDNLAADEDAAADAIAAAVAGEGTGLSVALGAVGLGIAAANKGNITNKKGIPEMIEEVQMLALSEDVEEDQHQQQQHSQPQTQQSS